MTDAIRGLRFIQISNAEDTHGTAEAATEILLGNMAWPADDHVIISPEGEDRSSMARYHANHYEAGKVATMQYTGDANARHACWFFTMAVRGNITPTQPDSTNEPNTYQWLIIPSVNNPNTPDQTNGIETYTIEYGDNLQGYETEYCFATRLEYSGAPNEAVRCTVDITGRQKSDATKTGALSVASFQRMPFNLAKYYRDSSWANLGNTQKTGVLKGFTWALDTMFAPRFTSDGDLLFSAVDEEPKAPELTLVLVRGDESDALRTAYEDQSTVWVRMSLLGATELDSGQSNPPEIRIDGAYHIPSWPTVGDDQGTATVEVPLVGCYDSTGANMFQVRILTLLSAFPT